MSGDAQSSFLEGDTLWPMSLGLPEPPIGAMRIQAKESGEGLRDSVAQPSLAKELGTLPTKHPKKREKKEEREREKKRKRGGGKKKGTPTRAD